MKVDKVIDIVMVIVILIGTCLLSYNVIRDMIRNDFSDAYVYVPDGARASYTDVKMFDCAWCKRTKNLNRHHIIPQSANPALRNEYSNIIVLCRDCHFVLGHRCNWKKFNPDVITIVETYTNTIVSTDYLNQSDEE